MDTIIQFISLLLIIGFFLFLIWIVRSIVSKPLRLVVTNDNHSSDVKAKVVVPLKIQACERLMLYLGRIRLQSLVKRVYTAGISRDDFHLSLIQSVSDEFEHNLTQRLYVSTVVWEAVENAKEQLLAQINAAFDAMPNEMNTSLIAQMLVSMSATDIDHAIDLVKREFNMLTEDHVVK